MQPSKNRLTPVVAVALVLLACSRDQDTPPQDDTGTSAVDATSNTNPSTLDTTLTDPTGDVTSTGGDATDPTGDSGTTSEGCLGPEGCFACDPENNAQLLNHCTDSVCEPFVNTPERLPLLGADGSLPPIP